MKLGGGSEALLGFVEGTLGAGQPCSGTVYAAARRCVKDFPKPQPTSGLRFLIGLRGPSLVQDHDQHFSYFHYTRLLPRGKVRL
jgi:hypothetical protein